MAFDKYKLYTESQIIDALENEDFSYITNIVIAQMQEIEIPSEETISKASSGNLDQYHGAMWLRNEIIKQLK
jgi:hypothetical protein